MSTSSNAPARTMNAFGGAAFLGRTAVIAHAALDAVRGEVVLHRGRRQQRRRAQQVVAAAMAVAVAGQRLRLGDAGLLADSPGSASYSPRMAITGPPSPASPITAVGMPATFCGDAEALAAPASRCARRRSGIRCSRAPACPDAVAQGREIVLAGIDQPPDLFSVLHDVSLYGVPESYRRDRVGGNAHQEQERPGALPPSFPWTPAKAVPLQSTCLGWVWGWAPTGAAYRTSRRPPTPNPSSGFPRAMPLAGVQRAAPSGGVGGAAANFMPDGFGLHATRRCRETI